MPNVSGARATHTSSDAAAGGDIKAIRQAAIDAPFTGAPAATHTVARIFQAEYRLVADLAALHVPAVALCHGVWMGFGVGLAGFLPFRIVTETTVFAMPECSIGVPRYLICVRERERESDHNGTTAATQCVL